MIDQTARFYVSQTFPDSLKGTNHRTSIVSISFCRHFASRRFNST